MVSKFSTKKSIFSLFFLDFSENICFQIFRKIQNFHENFEKKIMIFEKYFPQKKRLFFIFC